MPHMRATHWDISVSLRLHVEHDVEVSGVGRRAEDALELADHRAGDPGARLAVLLAVPHRDRDRAVSAGVGEQDVALEAGVLLVGGDDRVLGELDALLDPVRVPLRLVYPRVDRHLRTPA